MNIDAIKGGAVQYRSAVIESIDADTREMLVKAVPYGIEADIGGNITEKFLPGAFARAAKAPHRLNVWAGHGGALVGRGLAVEDRPDGVWVRAKIGRSQAATDLLTNIEDDISKDISIEFQPMPDFMEIERRGERLFLTHRRAFLLGYAVVPEGAYGSNAYVASVREDQYEREIEAAKMWLLEYTRRNL